mmetsp:Transcript_14805/g.45902  ORF Transcript_14805/g.45902 Transcript_14805/m.45902 type:complete len:244 (+) Transcript_14805:201-932(+)
MDLLPVCHRCRVAPETKQSEESLQRNGRAPCQPFVLDIHVLGSNLAAGQLSQIYLRVLFNGRFVANDPETASGPLVFTLATNLLSADDHLLVELWESMGKKKPILHAEQDKFLGEGQIFSGVLRNPPPHRIDLPLRPRESSGPESITGSLCVYLAPRTRGTKRHWQNQVQHPARALRNRHLVNITDPDRGAQRRHRDFLRGATLTPNRPAMGREGRSQLTHATAASSPLTSRPHLHLVSPSAH